MRSEFLTLSRDPLTITVAGTRIEIPYRPAAVWAKAIRESHRLPVAAGLADEPGRETLADLLVAGGTALADLRAESHRILEEIGGRRWWEVATLLNTSVSGEVLGRMLLAGLDPWERSLGEWCAATYALCLKGQDEKGRIKFEFSLSIPPPGYEDQWDDGGDDPAAVEAAMKLMGGAGGGQ